MKEFNYTSVMQARLEKIVINQGLGAAVADKKIIEMGINELTAITGQKAVQTVSVRISRTSSCVRRCRLVCALRYVTIRCTSF